MKQRPHRVRMDGMCIPAVRKMVLCAIGIMLLYSGVGWSASSPAQHQEMAPLDGPRYHSRSVSQRVLPASVSQSTRAAIPSPGTIVGLTYADAQHVGSSANQLAVRNGTIQVAFLDLAEADTLGEILVKSNRLDVAGSPAPVTLDNGETIRILPLGSPVYGLGTEVRTPMSLYPSLDQLPDGRVVTFYAWGDPPLNSSGAGIEVLAGTSMFTNNSLPHPVGVDTLIEPRGIATYACGDTMLHMVVPRWGGTTTREIWYWRGMVSGDSATWDSPVLIDTVGSRMPLIVSHGDSVAIVYNIVFAPEHSRYDRDLVYKMSTDCGITWSGRVSISNYGMNSEERFWTCSDALFDDAGTLHVIWHTIHNDTLTDVRNFDACNLNHWNSDRGTTRRITGSNWSNLTSDGSCSNEWWGNGTGFYQLTVASLNLALKPAGAGPGSGHAEELLYAFWAQSGPTPDDCAAADSAGTPGGLVNSEIYMSISSDDGFSWDRPQNLTGTRTPDCLPGDCHSEHWVSAAERADSGVYIGYTDDTHAGPAPGGPFRDVEGLGEWSESPYRVMAVEARLPVLSPVIHVGPVADFVELHVGTSTSAQVEVMIENQGNTTLDYTVDVANDDGGLSHVQVNGGLTYSSSIGVGAPPEIVTIEYNGSALPDPSEHNWRLEITSNDSINNPSLGGQPVDISLNVFVADAWYTCAQDTISTGSRRLAVSSCLELGDKGNGGGLYNYSGASEWLFDASPVIAWLDGGTKRAYRDIFWTTSEARSRHLNQAYRAQSELTVVRDTQIASGMDTLAADLASGIASSTDSLFQLQWEVVAFKDPDLANGAVMKYVVTNPTATTRAGLYLGAAADLDVDSMSNANNGIASAGDQYIGAQGGYRDPVVFIPQEHYAALFHIPLDFACADPGTGGQVLDNTDYVYPTGAYDTDSLFDLMSRTSAWNSATWQADTIGDVSVLLVSSDNQTLGADDTLAFAFGIALSDIDEADLQSTIRALRRAANAACVSCAIAVPGDVNESGSVTSADIIYLVNYVFKGDVAPLPCEGNGDVNCSGVVTSADIIYLVNFVFKGGPPPCNICTLVPNPWACP